MQGQPSQSLSRLTNAAYAGNRSTNPPPFAGDASGASVETCVSGTMVLETAQTVYAASSGAGGAACACRDELDLRDRR
jgi:hypothetical protein